MNNMLPRTLYSLGFYDTIPSWFSLRTILLSFWKYLLLLIKKLGLPYDSIIGL